MANDIFLSYARSDNERGLIDRLKQIVQEEWLNIGNMEPVRIFFDSESIRTMEEWELRIYKELRDASSLWVCMSPAYFTREWCAVEWQRFLEKEAALGLAGNAIAPSALPRVEILL